ncbi:MAG: hypothetical protein ACLRMN_17040 [Mediterraneibacter gnavus]
MAGRPGQRMKQVLVWCCMSRISQGVHISIVMGASSEIDSL